MRVPARPEPGVCSSCTSGSSSSSNNNNKVVVVVVVVVVIVVVVDENPEFVVAMAFVGHHAPGTIIVVCYAVVYYEIRQLIKTRPGSQDLASKPRHSINIASSTPDPYLTQRLVMASSVTSSLYTRYQNSASIATTGVSGQIV